METFGRWVPLVTLGAANEKLNKKPPATEATNQNAEFIKHSSWFNYLDCLDVRQNRIVHNS